MENTGWKPDFTQNNPYEGMPTEYAREVQATFVPTPEQPLSPVEVAVEKGQIPSGVVPPRPEEPVKVLTPATERSFTVKPEWEPKEYDWLPHERQPGETQEEYQGKIDTSKPNTYQDKSEFYSQEAGKFIKGTPPVNLEKPLYNEYYAPNSAMWKMGFKSLKDYYESGAAVSSEHPQLSAPYVDVETPEGPRHITKQEVERLSEIKDDIEQTRALIRMVELEKKYVVLGDKSLLERKDFNDFTPKEKSIAVEKGFNAFVDYRKRVNQELSPELVENMIPKNYEVNPADAPELPENMIPKNVVYEYDKTALKKLDKYGVGALKPGEQGPEVPIESRTFDITRYLYNNPNDTKTLKDAGFDDKDIKQAQDSANRLRDSIKYLDDKTTVKSMQSGKGLTGTEAIALERAFTNTDTKIKSGSGIVTWRDLPEDKKVEVASTYASDIYKATPITNIYASLATMGSKNIAVNIAGAGLAASILKPSVQLVGERVTPIDYVNAVVSVALIAVPFVKAPSAIIKVFYGGTSLLMAGETASYMAEAKKAGQPINGGQVAVSLAFSALLAAGAAPARATRFMGRLATEESSIGVRYVPKVLDALEAGAKITKAQRTNLNEALTSVNKAIVTGDAEALSRAGVKLGKASEGTSYVLSKQAKLMQASPEIYVKNLKESAKNITPQDLKNTTSLMEKVIKQQRIEATTKNMPKQAEITARLKQPEMEAKPIATIKKVTDNPAIKLKQEGDFPHHNTYDANIKESPEFVALKDKNKLPAGINTEAEYTFYKRVIKDRTRTIEQLEDAPLVLNKREITYLPRLNSVELVKQKISAIQGNTRLWGLKSSVDRFGYADVKTVYPKLTQATLKAESTLFSIRSEVRAPSRARLNEQLQKSLNNRMFSGKPAGTEAAWDKLRAGEPIKIESMEAVGYSTGTPQKLIIDVYRTKPIIKVAEGGNEWLITPTVKGKVGSEFTTGKPFYTSDPRLVTGVLKMMAGREVVYGEGNYPRKGKEAYGATEHEFSKAIDIPIMESENPAKEVSKALKGNVRTDQEGNSFYTTSIEGKGKETVYIGVKEFTTEKGSKYTVEGNATVREKEKGKHEPESDFTYYLTDKQVEQALSFIGKNANINVKKGILRIEILTPKTHTPYTIEVGKVSIKPKEGLAPLEVWGENKVHIGHKIIAIKPRTSAVANQPRRIGIPLIGASIETQATNLTTEIKETVDKQGMIKAVDRYGTYAVTAVYPYAFEYAIAEGENWQPPSGMGTATELPRLPARSTKVSVALEKELAAKGIHIPQVSKESSGTSRESAAEAERASAAGTELAPVIGTRISGKPGSQKYGQPQPKPQPAPQPKPQPAPQPKPQPAPQPKPQPAPQPKPQPAPQPKPQPAPQPKPQPAPQPKPQPAPQPKPQPAPQPKPQPAPQPKPQPAPQPKPQPAPQPKPQPAPQPKPVPTPTPTPRIDDPPPPPPPPPPPIPLKAVASDKEKRAFVNKTQGMVAFKTGQLNHQGVWRVRYYPYGENDRLVYVGAPPKGAIMETGKGSIDRSARILRGIPPKRTLFENTGAVDSLIIPSGKGISIRSIRDRNIRIPKTRQPRSRSASTGLRSKLVGKVFHTPTRGGMLLSRRPLGRKRR
jgi:hypothetical protein